MPRMLGGALTITLAPRVLRIAPRKPLYIKMSASQIMRHLPWTMTGNGNLNSLIFVDLNNLEMNRCPN